YDSPGVTEAAGAAAALLFHVGYEGTVTGLENLPGASQWRKEIERLPAEDRHLRTHVGHLTYLNDTDRKVINGAIIQALTFSGPVDVLRARLDEVARAGVTEVVYQAAGPDIERELTAFAKMAALEIAQT